ncbi:aspartate aminotransferase, cytoplasmic-like [Adelges cooleyi]|uniref:aspartate aminotransferase, cytoplasmic-like n=1 Tax=Adelges cooleyi TaxID=133065 RepID=UPI0021806EAC|nr:aspartate aminotransferase, cytoplasmic-like [Adelges cooleyi]
MDSKTVCRPVSAMYHLSALYAQDDNPSKVDLLIGYYKTEQSDIYALPVVQRVETLVTQQIKNHKYLPLLGSEHFVRDACQLLYGQDVKERLNNGTVFGVQTIGCTGGMRVGADLLVSHMNCTTFYVSDPTWENHRLIFLSSGFLKAKTYRYWNEANKCLDFEGLCEDLSDAPSKSVIVLQACGHNPTSLDPSKKQWERIADIIQQRHLIPFFDIAYQGFATGNTDKDAWVIRYFVSRGIELLCAQSFSKNFGLYNERVGNLSFSLNSSDYTAAYKSQIELSIRSSYSSAPNHGALTVHTIMNDNGLREEWLLTLKNMYDRVNGLRHTLRELLEKSDAPGSWSHITDGKGMFSYLGITENQVEHLRTKFHVYVSLTGRINLCSLNDNNIGYVAKSIASTLKEVQ